MHLQAARGWQQRAVKSSTRDSCLCWRWRCLSLSALCGCINPTLWLIRAPHLNGLQGCTVRCWCRNNALVHGGLQCTTLPPAGVVDAAATTCTPSAIKQHQRPVAACHKMSHCLIPSMSDSCANNAHICPLPHGAGAKHSSVPGHEARRFCNACWCCVVFVPKAVHLLMACWAESLLVAARSTSPGLPWGMLLLKLRVVLLVLTTLPDASDIASESCEPCI